MRLSSLLTKKRPYYALCMTLASLGLMTSLSGCATSLIAPDLGGYLYDDKINLADLNYAAADMLSQNAKISKNTPLVIGRLKNRKKPGSDVPFNTLVLEQVGTRLLQLGYDIKIRQDGSDFTFDGVNNSQSFSKRDVLLTGSYTPGPREFFVSLRLIRLRDSTLLGAYDYTIPVTRETRDMTYKQDTGGNSWFDMPVE